MTRKTQVEIHFNEKTLMSFLFYFVINYSIMYKGSENMKKKALVIGGGTGLSTLLKGLKQFPIDITAVVSVSDDGKSTGKLRKEFNIPAVGDIRRVILSLSETEPLFEKLWNYRFDEESTLDGHTVGNLLLTAMIDINGNISSGMESLGKVLNLKGRVLPFTEDNVTLVGEMEDGTVIKGEHNMTDYNGKIKDISYAEEVNVNPSVLEAIKEADLIILSMGSLYTSILPNLIGNQIKDAIKNSNAKIMYVCNMMTQPGETDKYTVSKHIEVCNKYLGKNLDVVLVNNGEISEQIIEKYLVQEQKDPVIIDDENIQKYNVECVANDYVSIEEGVLRHNVDKLALDIYTYLMK